MKLYLRLILAALPLAFSTGSASAYQLSPPEITSHLTGRLLLNPPAGLPFQCRMRWTLKTRSAVKKGHNRLGEIVAAIGTGTGEKTCQAAFLGLPWPIEVNDANSGSILGGSFLNGSGGCTTDFTGFSVNSSGVWTIPAGGCVSGTLTSN